MAGEDNAQMALARSLSEKIENAQRAWGKIGVKRPKYPSTAEPIILPCPAFDAVSLSAATIGGAVTEIDGYDATIPLLSPNQIAAMLLRLQEAGLDLEL